MGVFQELLDAEKSSKVPASLCLCYTVTFKDPSIFERKYDIELLNYKPYDSRSALLYYGRPYFRENDSGKIDAYPPITFLFNFDKFDNFQLNKVSSFDASLLSKVTGNENYTISNFSYEDPCLCILPVFVSLLFGDNDNFLSDEIHFERLDLLVQKRNDLSIIRDVYKMKKNKYGYPSASIEVRYLDKMPMHPFHIILPSIVRDNDSYKEDAFKQLYNGAAISYYGEDEYDKHQDLPPIDCHQLLRTEVKRVLKEMSQEKYVCKAFSCINENI
ncbi:hypothetical protein [Chitinophaga sp.]|uniref:hypothetical protein n=1 Tax=Chitinophaga sp. TaxID=1869181 RepID=UPI0031DB30E4